MVITVFRVALCALFLVFPFFPAAAQDGGDGLLAVPDSGGAQLNVNPLKIDEDQPSLLAPAPGQPVKRVRKGLSPEDLRIQGEDAEDPMWWMTGIFDKLPRTLQDDLLKQSNESESYCEENFMLSNFYDCECYGMAVLKDLVVNAGVTKMIYNHTADERFKGCVEPGKVAGYGYKTCQDGLLIAQMSDSMLEETCTCAARALARNYMKNPVANMEHVTRTFGEILFQCKQNASYADIKKSTP